MVTTDNYEEYLMMQADGELDAQELASLQAFLDAHPELAAEAAAWQDVKLVPEETVRFDRQESLLREEPKAIVFRPWYLAVPAAAALLLVLFLIPRKEQRSTTGPLAHNTAPATRSSENTLPETQNTNPESVESAVPVTNQPAPIRTRPRPRPQHLALNTPAAASAMRTPESIAGLPATQPNTVSLEAVSVSNPQLLAIAEQSPNTAAPGFEEQDRRVRIQLAAANVDALNALKGGLEQRIEQIGRVAKTVRETAVVVKFGGSAFHINL